MGERNRSRLPMATYLFNKTASGQETFGALARRGEGRWEGDVTEARGGNRGRERRPAEGEATGG